MREDQHQFLTLVGQPPAKLTVEQAAWVINCQPHDVPVLVSSRLLKSLGNPPTNGIKFFATADVLELVKDRSWLSATAIPNRLEDRVDKGSSALVLARYSGGAIMAFYDGSRQRQLGSAL